MEDSLQPAHNRRNHAIDVATVPELIGDVVKAVLGGEPFVQNSLVGSGEGASGTRRQGLGALCQVVDVEDTKKRETDILASVVLVPVGLSALASERLELGADAGVLRKDDIAGKFEDTSRSGAEGLLVELDVPDTGGAVLRVAGAAGVHEALLAGRVGADECGEAVGLDGLVLKELDQEVGRAGDGRQKVKGSRDRGVLAADVCANARTQGAAVTKSVHAQVVRP